MTTRPHSRLRYAAVALLIFGLGVAVTRWISTPAAPAPPSDTDGGVRLVIDAGAIELLPDASLRLDLPPGFDAGVE